MHVCLYGFMHSLHTFRVHPAHGAIAMEDSEERRRREVREHVQRDRRRLTAQRVEG